MQDLNLLITLANRYGSKKSLKKALTSNFAILTEEEQQFDFIREEIFHLYC